MRCHVQEISSTYSAALNVVTTILTVLGGSVVAEVIDFCMVHQQQIEEVRVALSVNIVIPWQDSQLYVTHTCVHSYTKARHTRV